MYVTVMNYTRRLYNTHTRAGQGQARAECPYAVHSSITLCSTRGHGGQWSLIEESPLDSTSPDM